MAGDGSPSLAERFQRDGHAVLRGALTDPVLRRARAAARREVERALATAPGARDPRQVDYFTVIQLCARSRALRDVVCAPQLARLAAEALGVARVRLLYDQLFAKPAGAVCTVWHQDQVYWPIDTSEVVEEGRVGAARIWVSLTTLPATVGGLHFVDDSHRMGPIDPTRVRIGPPGGGGSATIAGADHEITDYGGFGAGDATIHAGFTLHGSSANASSRTRYAVAVAYVPDGTRVAEPADEQHAAAIALHTPGRRPGDLVDSAANPVLWPVPRS